MLDIIFKIGSEFPALGSHFDNLAFEYLQGLLDERIVFEIFATGLTGSLGRF